MQAEGSGKKNIFTFDTNDFQDASTQKSKLATPVNQQIKNFSEMSEWESKKENTETTRQMGLLQNRILILQVEQEKKQKRVQLTQRRTDFTIQLREEHDQFMNMKEQYRQETLNQIKELNCRTRKMKQQSEHERNFIKQSLMDLKKAEAERVKQQQMNNQKQIEENKQESYNSNNSKKQMIQLQENQGTYNQNNFKRQKFIESSMDHQNNKIRNLNEKVQNQKKLESLEQQEMIWLLKNQQTFQQKIQADLKLQQINKSRSVFSNVKRRKSLVKTFKGGTSRQNYNELVSESTISGLQ